MKRRDLIKRLTLEGCILLRNGGKHDIYHNPTTGATQPVPRHVEINEILAKKIIQSLTSVK
jgi:predicted RNA binding protein YcfA (HicA-like mRNA interferase family)